MIDGAGGVDEIGGEISGPRYKRVGVEGDSPGERKHGKASLS